MYATSTLSANGKDVACAKDEMDLNGIKTMSDAKKVWSEEELESMRFASQCEYEWNQEKIQELYAQETLLLNLLVKGKSHHNGELIQTQLKRIQEAYENHGVINFDDSDD